ncbi:MAG: hypothetical protein JWN56_2445 [Sphingobacteriales bacterium]|nr:hypothetical protein [Sphingobacteriales bacterium]
MFLRKIFLLFILCNLVIVSKAQIKALTTEGEEVNLYDDGTWKYINDTGSVPKKEAHIDTTVTSSTTFSKSTDANFSLKSTKLNLSVFFNSKKWSVEKGKPGEAGEFNFQLIGEDVQAKFISERMEIPLNTLAEVAVKNAKKVAPDVKIIKKEYRIVNGLKVLFMQMDGTTNGIKFSYLGYYYSFDKGSLQFVSFTSQALLIMYRSSMEELLSGLVKQ